MGNFDGTDMTYASMLDSNGIPMVDTSSGVVIPLVDSSSSLNIPNNPTYSNDINLSFLTWEVKVGYLLVKKLVTFL